MSGIPASAQNATARAGRLPPEAATAWTAADWRLAGSLLLIACVVILSQSRFMMAIPGDIGDPRFNIVILEHIYRWVIGAEPALWSPRFFYPFRDLLAFSDNHFGSAPFYIVLRLVGLDKYAAFSGWYTIGAVLNFIACCFFLRALGFSGLASGAGAFLFSCALPVSGQIWHAQLSYRFASPLAMLALMRLLEHRDLKQFAWLACWVTVQFYCTIYIGVFLVTLILAWIGVLYLVGRRADAAIARPHAMLADALAGSSRRTRWQVAAVSLVALLALLYLLGTYQLVAGRYGFTRLYVEVATMLPRASSYLIADHSMLWWWIGDLFVRPPMFWEHRLFIGFGALALLGVGLTRGWSSLVKAALLATILLIIITLSVAGTSLYWFLFVLPGFNAIRAVSRIWFVEALPLMIIVAAGVDALTGRRLFKARGASTAALVLVGLMIVESALVSLDFVPYAALEARTAAVRAKIPPDLPQNAILLLAPNPAEPGHDSQLDAMLTAQELGVATLNGYTGNWPPGFDPGQPFDCVAGERQLASYVAFAHLDDVAFKALAARVVPIGFSDCDPTKWRLAKQ